MADSTISRGAMYGSEEGHFDAASAASGAVKPGPSPALFWIAGGFLLLLIRMAWENAG